MADSGQKILQDNDAIIRIEHENGRLLARQDDSFGIDRILIGREDIGDVNIKVSRQDIDVKTATPEQLIFSSEYNLFKIVAKSATTLTSPNLIGTSTFVNRAFTLGTKPVIFAFAALGSAGGTRYPLPIVQPQLTADPTPGLIAYQLGYEVVVDQLTFFWRDLTKAHNITAYITYYICLETAEGT